MMLRVKESSTFASRLRDAREAVHLSQVELARELGVAPRTVQNWEAGRTPQPRHRRAIIAFLERSKVQAANA